MYKIKVMAKTIVHFKDKYLLHRNYYVLKIISYSTDLNGPKFDCPVKGRC